MSFLFENCTFSVLDEKVLKNCQPFSCGEGENEKDLDDFFINASCLYSKELLGKSYCFRLDKDPSLIVCAFTVSNDSIRTAILPNARKGKLIKKIPRPKQMKRYPAVLIGRLGVNKDFKGYGIGTSLMTFIKSWFIDPTNKTGCRFVVVDSYNEESTKGYYCKNGFDFVYSTEEQEAINTGFPKDTVLKTRLMYFDLIDLHYKLKLKTII